MDETGLALELKCTMHSERSSSNSTGCEPLPSTPRARVSGSGGTAPTGRAKNWATARGEARSRCATRSATAATAANRGS